jgi:uncharacterized protein (DUF433 family)
MKIPFNAWQIAQLERLAQTDPSALEDALNAVYTARPDIVEFVVIGGVDQEEISVKEASQLLQKSEDAIEALLCAHRRRTLKQQCVVICEGAIARIADGGIPIWEIVRTYRQVGSLERLSEVFAGISAPVLQAALAYAEVNRDEIDDQIGRYEEMLERKRAEYPYAR